MGHGEDTKWHLRGGVEEHSPRALGNEEVVSLREPRERDGSEGRDGGRGRRVGMEGRWSMEEGWGSSWGGERRVYRSPVGRDVGCSVGCDVGCGIRCVSMRAVDRGRV